ncbi:hypothetical protein JTB14_026321 [Gonioctena quinquepunctata]|nr:hypothetical protein JTB14_026321 [Gonioctena quinquepunctata]
MTYVYHPSPRIDYIFDALQGGNQYIKLYLRNAYNQPELDDDTSMLLAWSTTQGIFEVKILPFSIPGVVNFLDDIVVSGKTVEEHFENLRQVLFQLDRNGLRLHREKCSFFENEIKYLGHIINSEGLKDADEISGISRCKVLENVTEVKAFCGMIN